MPNKETLGAANTGVRFKRDAAQQGKRLAAPIDSEVVPDKISDEGRQDCDGNGEAQIHLARSGKRAGGQQKGDRGQRQSDLFGKHNKKEHRRAVLYEKADPVFHVPHSYCCDK